MIQTIVETKTLTDKDTRLLIQSVMENPVHGVHLVGKRKVEIHNKSNETFLDVPAKIRKLFSGEKIEFRSITFHKPGLLNGERYTFQDCLVEVSTNNLNIFYNDDKIYDKIRGFKGLRAMLPLSPLPAYRYGFVVPLDKVSQEKFRVVSFELKA